MKKELYTDIKSRLETELGASIKHIALWNSQLDNEERETPFRFPALFIEFTNITYRSEGFGTQKLDLEFAIHCAFSQLIKDIDLLDIVDNVVFALHGHSFDYSTNIRRLSEEQDSNHDRVRDWIINFATTVTIDENATVQRLTQTTPATLEITADLDIDNNLIRSGDGEV